VSIALSRCIFVKGHAQNRGSIGFGLEASEKKLVITIVDS